MKERELDLEWVELVREALDWGISKKEIREYLQSQSPKASKEYKII